MKAVGKAAFQRLAGEFMQRIDGLRLYKEPASIIRADEICFCKDLGGDQLFLILNPYQKDAERFFVELGWSSTGRFPSSAKPSPFTLGELMSKGASGGIVRAAVLVEGKDRLWNSSSGIDDVLDLVCNRAWPSLERLVEGR